MTNAPARNAAEVAACYEAVERAIFAFINVLDDDMRFVGVESDTRVEEEAVELASHGVHTALHRAVNQMRMSARNH